jgi:DNA-binding HxlR family transcriptional regulator
MGAERSEPAREPARAWTHRQWTPLARALAAVGDRWTLLIVLQLASGPLRLRQLKDRLPGISSGALDGHVAQMTARGLISRRRFREAPPRVEVELTRAGRDLLPVAGALMRWGMRHMWSAPVEREQVHAAVLVRSLPVLLEDAKGMPDGLLEALVRHAGTLRGNGEQVLRLAVSIAHGAVRVESVEEAPSEEDAAKEEAREPRPDSRRRTARIEGDADAWRAAFAPAADYSALNIEGDVAFAVRVLGCLPGREAPAG